MFEDLKNFYKKLDECLNIPFDNPCSHCPAVCCNFSLYLSRYEFECIQDYIKENKIGIPLEFISEKDFGKNLRTQIEGWICPLYQKDKGCIVYSVRPWSCRLFPHYVPDHTKLPLHCVYKSPITYSDPEVVPLWEDYIKVMRANPTPLGYFLPFLE